MIEVRHYIDHTGSDPFADWREQVRDIKARISVDRRIMRVELGNFGDHKPLREGVWEMRIDVGQGYRVYYAKAGLAVVLRKRPARPPFARSMQPASCAFSSRGFTWKRCVRGASPGQNMSRTGKPAN